MKRWALVAMLMPSVTLAQVVNDLHKFRDQPKAEPFTEQVFGMAVDDPYRWMERPERREDMKRWVDA